MTRRFGNQTSNGLLLAIQHFACSEYGWDIEYVNDANMTSLLLLMRQKLAQEGRCGISLQDKEALDSVSWEELLRRNREELSKMRI